MSRQRLAIFSPGEIGGGAFSQGWPAIGSLVAALAERFDVTFYSLAAVDPAFAPVGYRLRAAGEVVDLKGLRWLDLARRFAADHLTDRYDRLLSLGGYPMGAFVVGLSKSCRVPAAVMLLGAETADLPSIGYGHLGQPLSRRVVIETCRRADALVAVAQSQLDALARCGFARPDDQVVPIGAEAALFPFEPKPLTKPLKTPPGGEPDLRQGPGDAAAGLRASPCAPGRAAADRRRGIAARRNCRFDPRARARGRGRADRCGPFRRNAEPLPLGRYVRADLALRGAKSFADRSGDVRRLAGEHLGGHIADLGEMVAVVVRAGDPRHIADRIVAIAGDADGWSCRVRAARGWAATHDMGWTVDRLSAILEGCGRDDRDPPRRFPPCLRSARDGDDDVPPGWRMTAPRSPSGGSRPAVVAGCACVRRHAGHARRRRGVTVARTTFAGWEALVLRNGAAEVTVVPAIGRIMQIALGDGGGARGPLWSHPGIGPTCRPTRTAGSTSAATRPGRRRSPAGRRSPARGGRRPGRSTPRRSPPACRATPSSCSRRSTPRTGCACGGPSRSIARRRS